MGKKQKKNVKIKYPALPYRRRDMCQVGRFIFERDISTHTKRHCEVSLEPFNKQQKSRGSSLEHNGISNLIALNNAIR